jgi:hypothetical protein
MLMVQYTCIVKLNCIPEIDKNHFIFKMFLFVNYRSWIGRLCSRCCSQRSWSLRLPARISSQSLFFLICVSMTSTSCLSSMDVMYVAFLQESWLACVLIISHMLSLPKELSFSCTPNINLLQILCSWLTLLAEVPDRGWEPSSSQKSGRSIRTGSWTLSPSFRLQRFGSIFFFSSSERKNNVSLE